MDYWECSELEIDKFLEVSGHELVDDEHHQNDHSPMAGNGSMAKLKPITAFEVLRQPVNGHTRHNQKKT